MRIKKLFEISQENRDCFFGYYDRPMSCPLGDKHVFLSVDNKMPIEDRERSCTATINIASRDGENQNSVLTTNAWSYQLGNLNAWLDNDNFVFHTKQGGRIQSNLFSLAGRTTRAISDLACYTLQSNTGLGVFFDIGRSGSIRPAYGLGAEKYGPADVRVIDIVNDRPVAELRQSELLDLFPRIENLFVFVEHAIFLNSKTEVILLTRAIDRCTQERHEMLVQWNFISNALVRLNGITKATHYCISHDDRVFAFGSASKLNRFGKYKEIIKRLPGVNYIRNRPKVRETVLSEQYRLLDPKQQSVQKISFFRDGHPTPFGDDIVFDTYEVNGARELYFFDLKDLTFSKLTNIASDPKTDGTPNRCDLHPRSAGIGRIAMDHIVAGKRQISFFEIERESI